ncbi:Gfo/Idh/MocA family oxidoreductase [Paraflavitalea speifideaquila]|uniref:Gfo/Idh/MocA family protein n=1 Tax=Paraflavitalea speifideaquila TaxID=3076558 RepID=UPI0028E6DF75|nr:Gfo/Idh/MocA family oxidoreductase [Paraflavitalea speifideiaquila]
MNNPKQPNQLSRRSFVRNTLTASVGIMIIPRFVMGGKGYTAPSDKITLGFIGTGKQSRGLVKGFASRAQVLAGADVDGKKLALFQQITEKLYADAKDQTQYKGFIAYQDFQELLSRKDIDAVMIATPDHWHAVQSIMAANAGKHVYCEKPLAHSIEEGRAMVKAMKRNDVILQTGSMQRSNKNFRHACELVRNGYLGEISEVLVNVGKPGIVCPTRTAYTG